MSALTDEDILNTPSLKSPAAAPANSAGSSAAPSSAFSRLLHRPRRVGLNNRRRTLITFIIAITLLIIIVVSGRLLFSGALQTDFTAKSLSPSLSHLFGTDWMGRDMLMRSLAGLSTSILVGLLAAGVSAIMAFILGATAALGGKKADMVITWLIDLLMGLPHIILLILISFAIGRGFWGITIGVAVTHWPNLARVIRAEILQCRESTFVACARKLGRHPVQIARDHMLPYVFPQFLTGLLLLFPHAILHEAALTFLGFGLPPEQPAIGVILSESMSYLSVGMWWLALFPGIALILVVLLFDRAGSNLRQLIDPHRSQE